MTQGTWSPQRPPQHRTATALELSTGLAGALLCRAADPSLSSYFSNKAGEGPLRMFKFLLPQTYDLFASGVSGLSLCSGGKVSMEKKLPYISLAVGKVHRVPERARSPEWFLNLPQESLSLWKHHSSECGVQSLEPEVWTHFVHWDSVQI